MISIKILTRRAQDQEGRTRHWWPPRSLRLAPWSSPTRSAPSAQGACALACKENHPGGNPGANLKSISHRCYLREVAFEWELTRETIYLPLGCLQGGSSLEFGRQGVCTRRRGPRSLTPFRWDKVPAPSHVKRGLVKTGLVKTSLVGMNKPG